MQIHKPSSQRGSGRHLGLLTKSPSTFCVSGLWEPARLPQKGQWTHISWGFFPSKLAPSDRFSLLYAPLQSEFSAVPGSFDTSKYLPNSQECEVPLFYCANLILQRTKPKDLQLPRCRFLYSDTLRNSVVISF